MLNSCQFTKMNMRIWGVVLLGFFCYLQFNDYLWEALWNMGYLSAKAQRCRITILYGNWIGWGSVWARVDGITVLKYRLQMEPLRGVLSERLICKNYNSVYLTLLVFKGELVKTFEFDDIWTVYGFKSVQNYGVLMEFYWTFNLTGVLARRSVKFQMLFC